MEAVNDKKEYELAKILGIDVETLMDYLKENKLNADTIKKSIENSNFDEEMISYLFNYDFSIYLNPFIFLLTKMKNSVKYMNDNLLYFDKYCLKDDVLRFYYGVANLINFGPGFLKKILLPLLKRFDKNLNLLIQKNENGKTDDIANFIKQLTNMLKFNNNGELNDMSSNCEYIRNIINVGYMHIFLRMANVDEKTFKYLCDFELQLSSDSTYGYIQSKFLDKIDLYDKVVFDKIVEMMIDDFELYKNEIYDLFIGYTDALEEILEIERYEEERKKQAENRSKEKSKQKKEKTKPNNEKKERNLKITYLNLEKLLKEKIIGQDNVIEKLIERIKTADFGISKDAGAKAVILLAGPTGVGKTEVVKLVSKNTGKDDNLIRIDMSEYKEEYTVSKLIGSPPGYIGYNDDDNTVFDKVVKNPNAIMLLDEIEKAHPEVLDVFLHIFDEGKATTNRQKEVDFRKIMIFMTTNIGALEAKKNSIGFDTGEDVNLRKIDIYKKALEQYLRPEFINRIDEILIFNILERKNIIMIIKNQIINIQRKLASKQINIEIDLSDSALDYLVSKIEFEKYGAREVRRVVEKYILNKIINLTFDIDMKSGILHIDCSEQQLIYNFEKSKILTKKKKEM